MKITKYILSFAAAAGLLAACQTPEIVQIASPENVVPASLHELEVAEIAISATNQQETVTFSWEAADYGAPTQINYSLEAALDETSQKVTILSGLSTNEATVTYEDLNRVLFNDLEVPEGQPTELKFYVGSVLYAGSSIASYPKVYSEPISVTVTVTAAEKVYPKVWVIGDYCGWSHDKTQYFFDFVGDDAVYQGVIDFGEKAANGWKVTGVAGWDDTCNWGGDEAATYEPEAAKTQLINGGGSKDLKHYSKRFYHFSFEKGTLLLTKTIGFDQIGVIGDFNGWGADVVMNFDTKKQKFYADVEFPADGGFKFRLDGAWDVAYGIEGDVLTTAGGNIDVKAGNYRVYLNMNNYGAITYELSKGDYGAAAPEPEPEPEPEVPAVTGWGLVGEYNSWGAEADVMLTSDGTFLAAKGVALSGQVKFRKDGGWDVNLGAPGDVEPVQITANTELALVANGKNFTIAEGTYDVYLDEANSKAWFINDGSYPGGGAAPEASEWGVVGVVNSWGGSPDITMYKTATEGLFVAYKVEMPDGGFKIRANNAWVDTANYGLAAAGPVEVDHVYDLICSGGSGDMTLVAGTYDIWFDLTNTKVYIMTPGKPISEAVGGGATPPTPPTPTDDVWGLVGTITNWADKADINMVAEGDWLVAKKVALTTSDEFKFRTNGTWGTERTTSSADPVAPNTEYAAAPGAGNIKVAVAGTYDIYLAKTLDKFYVMNEGLTPGQTPSTPEPEEPEFKEEQSIYGVIGVNNNWSTDIMMYTTPVQKLYVARNVKFTDAENRKFKVRKAGTWDNSANYGTKNAGSVAVNHYTDVWSDGGSCDITVELGTYDIYFDLAKLRIYVMEPGKDISTAQNGTPQPPLNETWYLRGEFNSWGVTDNAKMTSENGFYVLKNFKLTTASKLKFDTGSWSTNRGGTFSNSTSGFTVTQGGADISVPAGTYDVYLNGDKTKAYFLTPGTKPAN